MRLRKDRAMGVFIHGLLERPCPACDGWSRCRSGWNDAFVHCGDPGVWKCKMCGIMMQLIRTRENGFTMEFVGRLEVRRDEDQER